MDGIEQGTCDICKKEEVQVLRKYYKFEGVRCKCCNNNHDPHFELIRYCGDCTDKLPKIEDIDMGEKKCENLINSVYPNLVKKWGESVQLLSYKQVISLMRLAAIKNVMENKKQ